ncbi:hypothetical protein JOF56_009842 [Kibdelosporangium banguiense]|uniref:Uncharacterized protein n=1 Tax=Kibdelosporangium banguiense TaxID=1365924 RepID=A0ABS4TYI4_9PSEU|nr:hypothetical protein [Kibdelosporangium banguiense]MBP2329457.1 hypothetical protein [Kibdelosporangium banguiense]
MNTLLMSVQECARETDLPGLILIAFDLAAIAMIVFSVVPIAFAAGTLPAAHVARADRCDITSSRMTDVTSTPESGGAPLAGQGPCHKRSARLKTKENI